jgi:hypothetical protein
MGVLHLAALAIVGVFFAGLAPRLQASPISSATTEGFEGLSPGPNIPLAFNGVMKPGVNGPFTFPSGLTLINPIPNNPIFATGVGVGDWSIGAAFFGLAENGPIASVADVPDGTAYLDLDALPGPLEFLLPVDVNGVSALVTGTPGTITLSAFGASNNLLKTASIPAVPVSAWRTNMIEVESSAGIRKISFQNSSPPWDIVLDDVTFIPEPDYVPLVIVLGALFLARHSLRRQRARTEPSLCDPA